MELAPSEIRVWWEWRELNFGLSEFPGPPTLSLEHGKFLGESSLTLSWHSTHKVLGCWLMSNLKRKLWCLQTSKREEAGDGTASIMTRTRSERVAGYRETSCRYNTESSIGLAQSLLIPSFLSLPQCPLCVSVHPKCVPDTGRYLGRLEQTEFKSRLLRTFSLQTTSCLKLKKLRNPFNLLIKMTPSFCLLKGSGNWNYWDF